MESQLNVKSGTVASSVLQSQMLMLKVAQKLQQLCFKESEVNVISGTVTSSVLQSQKLMLKVTNKLAVFVESELNVAQKLAVLQSQKLEVVQSPALNFDSQKQLILQLTDTGYVVTVCCESPQLILEVVQRLAALQLGNQK